jgi:glycine/D-amino acid oxidase-like deaminating enzyme
VVAEVKIEESCIYTLTPDRNPVIDIMPGTNNIVIAAGFSGHKTTLTLSSDQKEKLEIVE